MSRGLRPSTPSFKDFEMKHIRHGKTMAAIAMLLLLGVTAFLCVMPLAKAEPIDTYHSGWHLVRASDIEDGATFAAEYDLTGVTSGISGTFADMNSSAFKIPTRTDSQGVGSAPGTKWKFVICGKLYDDVGGTFAYSLVGWAKNNGMLQVICEGTGALGDQTVVTYPDGGDALGELITTTAAYTFGDNTLTVTDEGFDGAAVGMMGLVTGAGLTDEIEDITTYTDANAIIFSGLADTADCTATVKINPSFWADTIVITSLTKWSAAGVADANSNTMNTNLAVLNSADNEVAVLVADLAGLEYVQFVFYDCDGANSEEAGALKVYGRPY